MGIKIDSVWGIEIGANSFNAIQLKKNKSDIAITSFHVFDYPKSIENEEEELVEFAKQGLMSLFGEGVIKKNDNIFVSIPGRHIFSRPIELPPMDVRKFYELIKYEASQQIPHNLDEVVWDYHLDHSEDNVNAILFAAHRDQVNRIVEIFQEAELQVVGIQSTTLAILNYLRHDSDFDKSSVLIDVKSKNIDFVISEGMRFWQRNIARGGDDINKALMTKFKIPFEQAEELKRNMSQDGLQAEKIQQIIQPVFKSMTNEIQRSIGHYCSQHEDAQIQDAFLIGNSHRMKTLVEHLKKNLRLKIHIMDKLGRLAQHAEVDLESFNKRHGDMVVPLGLGLQGLDETAITINLLPSEIIEARVSKKRQKWLMIAAIFFMFAGIWQFLKISKTREELIGIYAEGPKATTDYIKSLAQYIEEQEAKLPAVRENFYIWQQNLRDRETYFKRDAWITAINEISSTLYDPKASKQNTTYINEIQIEKDVPDLDISLKKTINDLIPMEKGKKASKVFKLTIKGSFFAEDEKDITKARQHILSTIRQPLNASSFIKGMDITEAKVLKHPEIGVPVCNYILEGYFVPPVEGN